LGLFHHAKRCAVCGGRARTNRQTLEIRESDGASRGDRARAVCLRCGPRLVSAATHGGVLHSAEGVAVAAPGGGLGVQMVPSTYLPPDRNAASVPLRPLTVIIWAFSVALILVFGALAIFASPLFFLGVLATFLPLGLLALRSE
jgi:hypothetical protein